MVIPWTSFKSYVQARGLSIQWAEDDAYYFLAAPYNGIVFECLLSKADTTNKTDFENNFKTAGNAKLETGSAVYLSTPPSLGNGQRAELQATSDGRLKVDAIFSEVIQSKKIKYFDAQLARDTTVNPSAWTDVYSYTGSGNFYGCILTLEGAGGAEGAKWYINVVVDTTESIFDTNGLLFADIFNTNAYNIDFTQHTPSFILGLGQDDNSFYFDLGADPIRFSSKIQVQIKRIDSAKKFKAGLIKVAKN